MNVWHPSTTTDEQSRLANANLYDCWDTCECTVFSGDSATQGDAIKICLRVHDMVRFLCDSPVMYVLLMMVTGMQAAAHQRPANSNVNGLKTLATHPLTPILSTPPICHDVQMAASSQQKDAETTKTLDKSRRLRMDLSSGSYTCEDGGTDGAAREDSEDVIAFIGVPAAAPEGVLIALDDGGRVEVTATRGRARNFGRVQGRCSRASSSSHNYKLQ